MSGKKLHFSNKTIAFILFLVYNRDNSEARWGFRRIPESPGRLPPAGFESTGCAQCLIGGTNLKKRLLSILLIAALLTAAVMITAGAAESPAANEKEIYTYLTGDMGLNTAAACGIMANIYYETNFTADISVSGYYGLFMYWSGLTEELIAWCAENGYDHTTVHGQMKFFHYKMESSYQNLLGALRGVSNNGDGAYSAADMFCRQFERPANANYEANKRGNYACGTLFPKYASGTDTPDAPPETSVSYTGYVTASVLNVRSGPGTGYSVTGSLSRGTAVSVVAESNGWCKLALGGWVSKTYISTEPVNASGGSSGQTYYVTASALNVRSSPGTGSDVIGCVYQGDAVTVVAEDTDANGDVWCKLASGGWVSKAYLSTSQSGGSGSGTSYTVTASALNVRSGPGTGNAVIDSLPKGTTVTIVATSQDANGQSWGQLSTGGWVSMEYLA